jgi:hypothetical protein
MPTPDPAQPADSLRTLHEAISSKAWWFFYFPGPDGFDLRDSVFDRSLSLFLSEDYEKFNIRTFPENQSPIDLGLIIVKKAQRTKKIIMGIFASAFPYKLRRLLSFLNVSSEAEILVLGGTEDEKNEAMKYSQILHDLDPDKSPPFPFHLGEKK